MRSVMELMKRVSDALQRGLEVLTLRRQDSSLLRRHFGIDSVVSVDEILEKGEVKFVGGLGRIAAIAELKEEGVIPFGYKPENLLFEKRYFDEYRTLLQDRSLFDVPLLLPHSLLTKFRGSILVVPSFLVWDADSFEGVADTVLVLNPAKRGVAERILVETANVANQARAVKSLLPDAVVAPSISSSLLAAYEVMDGVDVPSDRFLFYETEWRGEVSEEREHPRESNARPHFGEMGLRDSLFLLKRQPVFDWEPVEGKTILCPVFDTPLIPLKKVVLLSGVENETDDDAFSKAFHFISSLATEKLYILTYREAGGKPTHPVHTVAMLERSGEKREETKETLLPKAMERRPEKRGKECAPKPPLYASPLSPFALEKYHRCPRSFFFSRVLKIPEEEHPFIVLGSLLHRLLELYHKGELTGGPEAETERFLEERRELTEGERSLIKKDALMLFDAYLKSRVGEIGRTVETEMFSRFTIQGFEVRGRIDRVVETDEGYIAIDYKTKGKKKKEQAHLNRIRRLGKGERNVDFQAPLYMKALEEKGLTPIRAFSYIYLDSDNTFQPHCVTLAFEKIAPHMETVLNKVVELIKKIREDTQFLPPEKPPCRTSSTISCPFLDICTVKKV